VHSVLGSHLIAPRARAGRGAALVLALALACAIASAVAPRLGHERAAAAPGPAGVALVGGLPLQQARCEQWLAAAQPERDRALDALHGVVGGPTPYGPATALTRAEAERLFDRTCSNPIARNFLLYELYTRAAGFRSLVDPDV
jgi:hypothetical protein